MLLHKLCYDFNLDVSCRRGSIDPLNIYSINCTLYETARRPNPIPEKFLEAFQGKGVYVVGQLEGFRVLRESMYRGYSYKLIRETQVFVGPDINSVMQQMEDFIQDSIRQKNKFRPRRPNVEKAAERLTIYSRGY